MTIAAPAKSTLIDQFQRRISYLRLSVTDRCDLRCAYCMPERQTFLPRAEVLSLEELHELALGFIARGITKIRLTGGEPLVRRDMIELVQALGRKLGDGLERTDHDHQCDAARRIRRSDIARGWRAADQHFARYARPRRPLPGSPGGIRCRKLWKVSQRRRLRGWRSRSTLSRLKGINEAEIPALIEWAHGQGFELTLIEVMPLGEVEEDRFDHYLPLSAMRESLEQRWTLTGDEHRSGGPARYVTVAETGGRLGFITPLTNNFCDGCNRIRVTATGQLYACLGGTEQVDLRAALRSDAPAEALDAALDTAMRIKPLRHHFAIDKPGAAPALARHMSMTGG